MSDDAADDNWFNANVFPCPHCGAQLFRVDRSPMYDAYHLYCDRFFAGPVVSGAHLKILTVQFVTAKRASELMYGESVGRPAEALVC